MAWILIGSVVFSIFAAAPTIYTIFGRGLDWSTIGVLWRFSPNQFFFTLFIAPFTTCLTGCALWWTVSAARTSHQPGLAQTFAHNWPIAFLWPLALGAFLAGAFFINITWSPDKLKTPFATQAADAIQQIETDTQSAANSPAQIAARVAKAKDLAPATAKQHNRDIERYLPTFSAYLQMQILMDGNYQRTLRLTDEATASLNGFQVWLILAAGLINGMCATVVLLLRQSSRLHGVDRALGHAQLGILFATLSLLLYAYLFSMYKQQSSQIVGPGFTSNQDIVASLGVGLCLLLLFLSIDEKFSAAVIPTIAGIVAVVAEIAGAPKLSIFRTLFGWETKVSTQLVLICAVVILGVICVYAVRPQSALAR